jgi:hypothetical protein
MIYYFATREHTYTIQWFLADWASLRLKKHLQFVPYDLLPDVQGIAPATIILSDLDRLNSFQLKIVRDFCNQITAADKNVPIINHPRSVVGRYRFLRKLYELGYNKFNVYRISDVGNGPCYPVFLRMDNDHKGPCSKLLYNSQQLDRAIFKAKMHGFDRRHIMLVEYCDTRDAVGYYRKYSAFRIRDQIIPGHLIFNNDWLVKEGKPPFETSHEDEKAVYLRENPHKEKIYEIFELAGVNYGRIDYSILNGTIQTWEINTNPILNQPRRKLMKERKDIIPAKEKLAIRLEENLMSLNYGDDIEGVRKGKNEISLKWDMKEYR